MALFDRLFKRGRSGNHPNDHALTMARAMPHLQALTAMHAATWKIQDAAWDVDLEVGTLTFRFDDGRIVTAPVQVIGTYNTDDGTFLWGWDHPSVADAQAADANLVKAFGEKHGVAELTTRKVTITEERAWELTALACLLADAQGAYRGPSGRTLVFMTFGAITMHGHKKPPPRPGDGPDDSDWGRGLPRSRRLRPSPSPAPTKPSCSPAIRNFMTAATTRARSSVASPRRWRHGSGSGAATTTTTTRFQPAGPPTTTRQGSRDGAPMRSRRTRPASPSNSISAPAWSCTTPTTCAASRTGCGSWTFRCGIEARLSPSGSARSCSHSTVRAQAPPGSGPACGGTQSARRRRRYGDSAATTA